MQKWIGVFLFLPVLFGCSGKHVKSVDYKTQALFTINNVLMEDVESDVVLDIENGVRIDVPYNMRKTAVIDGRKTMMEFSLFISELGYRIIFFAGVRPGHTYTMRFSPCCLFQIDDKDDDPYEFSGDAVFTDSVGKCPEGFIALFPGLAKDPPGKHRCITAPRMRFVIPEETLSQNPVTVYIGESIGNDPVSIDERRTDAYFSFDIIRNGSPEVVRLVQKGNILWEGSLVLRVKHSYTLEYNPNEKNPVVIHLDD